MKNVRLKFLLLVAAIGLFTSFSKPVSATEIPSLSLDSQSEIVTQPLSNGRQFVAITVTYNKFPPLQHWYDNGVRRGWLNRGAYNYANGKYYCSYSGYIYYNAPITRKILN